MKKVTFRGWAWNVSRGAFDRMDPAHAADPIFRGSGVWQGVPCTIVKCDVDHARPLSVTQLAQRFERAGVALKYLVERRSPSGRGWHRWLWVWPAPATAVETVALQLLAGSDPLREAYCLNRARQVDRGGVPQAFRDGWNVLYKETV